MPNREFYVVISKGKDGSFVGEVPQLRDCHSNGRTLDELMKNIRKTIESCLEDDDLNDDCGFVGFYKIEV